MVSSIGSTPYSYYNTLNPVAAVTPVASTTSDSASGNTDATTTSSTPTDSVSLSQAALASLQQLFSSGSGDGSNNSLFGGSTNNNADVYTTILTAAYIDAPLKAYQDAEKAAANTKPVASGYDAYAAISNLVPTTQDPNVQSVIDANSYLPDGTPITG